MGWSPHRLRVRGTRVIKGNEQTRKVDPFDEVIAGTCRSGRDGSEATVVLQHHQIVQFELCFDFTK